MKKMYALLLVLSLLIFSGNSYSQISVTNNAPYNTAQYLIQNVLLGSGVIASNFTYNGAPVAVGFFNGVNTNLNLDSGIIITSGLIDTAVGPNNESSAAQINNLNGDPDLDAIMSPTLSYDASILEFDFVPMADTVKFRYVFGSDEYMEWVSTTPGGINDGFGFFLSGPGINGPYSNQSENIAIIPNTALPVTMFNLNLNNNGQYYFDNGDGQGTGTAPDGPDVQYDGFTVPLVAKHWVQCGQTYHIKIAIGDGGDWWIDSGVFLEAGSFTSTGINITADVSYGGPNDSTLFEGCGQACLYFVRGNTQTQDTVTLNVSGNAQNGVDYTPSIPSQIIFPVGVDSVVICISAVSDNQTEGLDTVHLAAVSSGPCAQGITNVTFFIGDHIPMVLNVSNDTTVCPNQQVFLNANVSGGVQPYGFSWSTGSTAQGILVTPSATTTYSVAVTDSCGANIQSSVITVTVPPNIFVSVSDVTVCEGQPITIAGNINGGVPNYNCSWVTLTGPDSIPANNCTQQYTFTPTANGTFVFTATDQCNRTSSDTLDVLVDTHCQINIPNVFTPNGDGLNDLLVFKNLDHFPGSGLKIFNRWGGQVYESSNYQNDWSGAGVPDGTYFFVLHVSDGKEYKGFVEILSHK
ncbi:MAG TPA: choice-of-anchor L domain-containing protein [Bacteroidia bacterium]|jgi:gliding motility-associated-like protein